MTTSPSAISNDEYIVRSPKTSTESLPKVSVAEMIAEQISTYDKDELALIDPNDNSNLTYSQLQERATQFATALLRLGVEKTDFVMFYGENSFECVIAMLATIYLGLSFCPIPPSSGPFELSEQSKGADGTILVFGTDKVATVIKTATEAAYRETMRQFKVFVQMETVQPSEALKQLPVLKESGAVIHSFEEMISLADDNSGPQLKTIPHFVVDDLEKEFLLCFTSGTTGVPKPAIHTNRSIGVCMIRGSWGPRAVGLPTIMWHPLGHISGSFIILYALYAGCSVILFKKNDIEPILQAVERYKASYFLMAANQAAPLAAIDYHKKYDLSSLKGIPHGGSFIATSMLLAIRSKYQVPTINLYGSTEFFDCVEGYGAQMDVDNFLPGCVGHVKQGVEVKIVDLETGKSLPPNKNGEICFRGQACFSGYKGNPEATKKTIIDGWYYSGDVGYYDEQGRLFITDRIKEMIKYKLYSLIPAEIEDFIQRHPAVTSACVVGVPHASEGHHIRAYVVLAEGQKVSEEELCNYVSENMGTQKKLRAGVRFINSMPRTLIGKVDRQYFKKLVKDELITRTYL